MKTQDGYDWPNGVGDERWPREVPPVMVRGDGRWPEDKPAAPYFRAPRCGLCADTGTVSMSILARHAVPCPRCFPRR